MHGSDPLFGNDDRGQIELNTSTNPVRDQSTATLELLIIQMDEGVGFGLPTDLCGILATLAAIRDQLQPSALKILQ
jgi:hypothetical protein